MTSSYAQKMAQWLYATLFIWLVFAISLGISGCKKNVKPPDLFLNVGCVNGAPEVRIANNGGAMAEQDSFMIRYEDGTSEILGLQLDANKSLVCTLSNLHGGLNVEMEGSSLSGNQQDCLTPEFQKILEVFAGELELSSWIPVPLLKQDILVCHYTFYLENIAYNTFSTEVVPVEKGMNAKIEYMDVTGEIWAESDSSPCANYSGNLTISNIIYRTDILFDDQSASLGNADTNFNGIDVKIDGPMGSLGAWMVDFFGQDFAKAFEAEIATGFESTLEPALSAILIEEKRCE